MSIRSTTAPKRIRPASSARHRECHRGRTVGDLEALPALEVVEAVAAEHGVLAQVREQRGALGRVAREESDARSWRRRTAGSASSERSQAPTLSASSAAASGCDQGSSGSRPSARAANARSTRASVGELLGRHPRRLVADVDTVDQSPAHLPRLGDVARLDRQARARRPARGRRCAVAEDLAAGLDGAAVGQRHRLDPAAGPLARLEHDHVRTGAHEVSRRAQPAQSGTQHSDIEHVWLLARSDCRSRSAA